MLWAVGVYIVGMHRSGTSVLTAVTAHLLGRPLAPNPVPSNPEGQWENLAMRASLELLLTDQGATWEQPAPLGSADRIRSVTDRFARRSFGRSLPEPFIWKDPRLCLTIDYWLSLPQERPRIIVTHRHPLAVAESLQRRNGMDVERGLALWERTNLHMIGRLDGCEIYSLSHESLTGDAPTAVRDLGAWLSAPDERIASAAALVRPLANRVPEQSTAGLDASTRDLHHYLESTAGLGSFPVSELPAEGQAIASQLGRPSRAALSWNRIRALRTGLRHRKK